MCLDLKINQKIYCKCNLPNLTFKKKKKKKFNIFLNSGLILKTFTYEYTIFDLNNFMCTISKLECAVDVAP